MHDITARPRLLSVTESIVLPPQPSRWSDARYRKIRHSRVAGAAGLLPIFPRLLIAATVVLQR
jgi:hypothetical protein